MLSQTVGYVDRRGRIRGAHVRSRTVGFGAVALETLVGGVHRGRRRDGNCRQAGLPRGRGLFTIESANFVVICGISIPPDSFSLIGFIVRGVARCYSGSVGVFISWDSVSVC